MTTDLPEEKQAAADDHDDDWDHRVLCSDGNCIGVIGADGCCKECGKKYEGELPRTVIAESEPPAESDEDEPPAAEVEEPDPVDNAPVDDDWENRVLCSDGNCIGVIGRDGKCRECGKPAE